jgi:hypothetical protein
MAERFARLACRAGFSMTKSQGRKQDYADKILKSHGRDKNRALLRVVLRAVIQDERCREHGERQETANQRCLRACMSIKTMTEKQARTVRQRNEDHDQNDIPRQWVSVVSLQC